MKILVNFNKNISTPKQVKSFKVFDLGIVLTTINDLLDSATIEIDDQTLPILKINNNSFIEYYLINDLGLTHGYSYPYYTDDFMKEVTIGDLVLINNGRMGEENIQADWNQINSLADDFIKNKPELFSGDYNDLINTPALVTNHSELTLDDGTNPHGTTKGDLDLENVPNIDATNRANHTGTQLSTTISDLQETIEDTIGTKVKAGANVSVSYNDTTGETTISSTDNGEVNTASNIGAAGVGVFKQKTGANLEFKKINSGSNKVIITDDVVNNEVDINVVEANFTGIPQSAVTNLTADLSHKADLVGGKVPASQLPSSVFNVIEGYFNGTNFYTDSGFTNLITPESGKIYINLTVTPATQYRWSGSAYVQIGGGKQNMTVIAKNVVDSSLVTGTTSDTIVESFVIPANTFQPGDILIFECSTFKTGTAGGLMHRHGLTGNAAIFFTQMIASSSLKSQIKRMMIIKSSTVSEEIENTATVSPYIAQGAFPVRILRNINWSINQTFNVSIRLTNASDSAGVSFWMLSRIRN